MGIEEGGVKHDRFEAMAREVERLQARVEQLEHGSGRKRRRSAASADGDPGTTAVAATTCGGARTGPAPVSRRRLFGLMGGAVAAGAGLAAAGSTLAANPAAATTGNMQFGLPNDAGNAPTSLTSTATTSTFEAANTGGALALVANSTGPQAQLNGATSAGPPTGAATAGELFVDNGGIIWYATDTGTPADWVPLSLPPVFAPITPTPVRVYDSRAGQAPTDNGPKGTLQPNNSYVIDISDHGAVDFTGAYAALLNLSLVTASSGGFLAIFPNGTTYNNTANILWQNTGLIANSATTLFDGNNEIIAVTSNPTDLIIDLFGLYLG
jgi:hypothetical protein